MVYWALYGYRVASLYGERLWVFLLYLSTILVFKWWRSLSLCCTAAIHCRGLTVKEWNHGVGGQVGVTLVIGQYLGLGPFQYCRMARATLLLTKEPWGPVFPFTILFAVFNVSSAQPLDCQYAPIEGEAAAIAWALEKCHIFIMGCPQMIVVTNHQPLTGIFGDRDLSKYHCFSSRRRALALNDLRRLICH